MAAGAMPGIIIDSLDSIVADERFAARRALRKSLLERRLALTAAAPEITLRPYAPRAPGEAEVSWRVEEVPCGAAEPCAVEALRIEGAFNWTLRRRVAMAREDCAAWRGPMPQP